MILLERLFNRDVKIQQWEQPRITGKVNSIPIVEGAISVLYKGWIYDFKLHALSEVLESRLAVIKTNPLLHEFKLIQVREPYLDRTYQVGNNAFIWESTILVCDKYQKPRTAFDNFETIETFCESKLFALRAGINQLDSSELQQFYNRGFKTVLDLRTNK